MANSSVYEDYATDYDKLMSGSDSNESPLLNETAFYNPEVQHYSVLKPTVTDLEINSDTTESSFFNKTGYNSEVQHYAVLKQTSTEIQSNNNTLMFYSGCILVKNCYIFRILNFTVKLNLTRIER